MNDLCERVLKVLRGKSLVTAESCTGGGIGAELTAIPGSSAVYKGGVICYTNWVKEHVLGIDREVLAQFGAVSQPVAGLMASKVRKLMQADVAVAVTGLAGPCGDGFCDDVGTVYIGYESQSDAVVRKYRFPGDRQSVREQAIKAALMLILEYNA